MRGLELTDDECEAVRTAYRGPWGDDMVPAAPQRMIEAVERIVQARVDAAVEKVAQAIESEASRSSYRDPYEVTDAYLQAANIARAALRDATHTDTPEVTP